MTLIAIGLRGYLFCEPSAEKGAKDCLNTATAIAYTAWGGPWAEHPLVENLSTSEQEALAGSRLLPHLGAFE